MLLGRLWALNYLHLPVLYAASRVLPKVWNEVNKDKNHCTISLADLLVVCVNRCDKMLFEG